MLAELARDRVPAPSSLRRIAVVAGTRATHQVVDEDLSELLTVCPTASELYLAFRGGTLGRHGAWLELSPRQRLAQVKIDLAGTDETHTRSLDIFRGRVIGDPGACRRRRSSAPCGGNGPGDHAINKHLCPREDLAT
jgi:hypothetical protein